MIIFPIYIYLQLSSCPGRRYLGWQYPPGPGSRKAPNSQVEGASASRGKGEVGELEFRAPRVDAEGGTQESELMTAEALCLHAPGAVHSALGLALCSTLGHGGAGPWDLTEAPARVYPAATAPAPGNRSCRLCKLF